MTNRKLYNAQCAFYWHHDRWPWTAISSNFRSISRDFTALWGNNSKPNEDRPRHCMYSSELCSLHRFAEDFFAIVLYTVYTQCRALTLALARLSCNLLWERCSMTNDWTYALWLDRTDMLPVLGKRYLLISWPRFSTGPLVQWRQTRFVFAWSIRRTKTAISEYRPKL